MRRRGYGFPVNVPNVISDLTSGLSKTQFQEAIQDERARELCFETQRRPDLIRWGIWTQTMSALSNQISTDLGANTLKYAAIPAANAASSPKFLLYPIPASEITVNKAATQNPGY